MVFWRALESTHDFAGVRSAWVHLLGDEHEFIRPLLVPEEHLARSFELGTRRTVFEHGDDDFVVLDDEHREIHISREDLIIWSLCPVKLAACVQTALGIQPTAGGCGSLHSGLVIGEWNSTKRRAPVILLIARSAEAMTALGYRVIAESTVAPVVLTPTGTFVSSALRDRFRAGSIDWIPLEGNLSWKRRGVLGSRCSLHDMLPRERTKQKAKVPRLFFPPAGTRWSDFLIRFEDLETMTISLGQQSHRLSYVEAGFNDERKGEPNLQWKLLQAFADSADHVLRWDRRGAARNRKSQKEELNRKLQSICGLSLPAFEKEGSGWRPLFRLKPCTAAKFRDSRGARPDADD